MAFTFDGLTKIIQCDVGTTQFSASSIYSDWKRWVTQGDNAKYVPAFDLSVGGNPLGGAVLLGAYYFLQNGWKIRPQDSDHTLIIEGNLFPVPDDAGLFLPTVSQRNVLIAMRTSSLTQQLVVEAEGGGSVDANAVADAVWTKDISAVNTPGQAGTVLNEAETKAAEAKQAADLAAALSA